MSIKIDKNNLLEVLSRVNSYETLQETYSPFCSNIGLILDERSRGVDALWLHYNRFSRTLWEKLIDLPFAYSPERSDVTKLTFGDGEAALAFYGTDCFLLEYKGNETVGLFRQPSDRLPDCWVRSKDGSLVILQGYSANGDARDPDNSVCFLAGVRAVHGTLSVTEEGVTAVCDDTGRICLAFAFEFLEISEESLKEKLYRCPETVEEAAKRCGEHLLFCAGDLSLTAHTETEAAMIAKALHGLLFNLTRAPGDLVSHLSSFPNRGTYPTHFLWDTCFQNLAYELMNVRLVKDFLLQFAVNQRADGKYPQFLCSTWARPQETQPALIGWATLRFAGQCKENDFLFAMLSSLERNNDWWLSARMTSKGLVSCPHGLETGQDDSPRFDDGPTLATDMNSYLLSQLNATAALAESLGETDRAARWRMKADKLSAAMLRTLYCEEDNLFYDVNTATDQPVKIVSPVSLLPLWAGVGLPENKSRDMIERYLLSPEYLFGEIPFPSVACNEESYEADHWWRGPTWLPEAWLMLETLDKFSYTKEKEAAQKRLYEMLLKDVSMHELFDSQTGKGLGSEEQGWTCAIFLKLCKIING